MTILPARHGNLLSDWAFQNPKDLSDIIKLKYNEYQNECETIGIETVYKFVT